ncbi:MAG: sugar ABC transporter permease [Thermotogae bacterium]|uniref:Sugar ABC transporter permease n=1 Tax=Kosmotoga arenicorallina TaxID=688066 RepID=A0A7C5E296_9BACT|nr:sugar ABC transporter permease [Kosmotoga sp.]MBO8166549.1 sugar ABC transporter permease [Kosmotoga sp.]RKX50924.1 MAG: sugar ABC transporter permease [Thermotogota bacterium]HHF08482.1 sugar ABC transporter permease [Kosmotoga arenicorallina]
MAKMFYEKKRGFKYAFIFLLPGLALLITFIIIPFLSAFYLSFTNQRLISRLPIRFIGLTNYKKLLDDDLFWKGLFNIFKFVIIVVPLQTAFALALALLVNKRIKFTKFFRTVYFMPTVTTMVVVAVIWTFLYNPEGFINLFLQKMSFGSWQPVDFIKNENWAFPAIMFMSIWQGVGFQMLIFLAGLQEIPVSLYEAATIDGANNWQKFRKITLPQLKNTTAFVIISTTILAFRLFDQVKVMTDGGPNAATYTVVLHIYNMGFKRQYIGYASALTVVFFLLVLAISVIQRFLLKEEREVS